MTTSNCQFSVLEKIRSSATGLLLAFALILNMSAVTSTGFFCTMSGVSAFSPCGCAHDDDQAEDESESFERVSCCSQTDSTTQTPDPRYESKAPKLTMIVSGPPEITAYVSPRDQTIVDAWSPRGPPLPPDTVPLRVTNQSFLI